MPTINARIEMRILVIRGQRVMTDADLGELYGVSTKALNQAVKRNSRRFPGDFMFRLTSTGVEALNRSQTVTGSQRHRDPRFPPFAFPEQSVAMLSSVLKYRKVSAPCRAHQEKRPGRARPSLDGSRRGQLFASAAFSPFALSPFAFLPLASPLSSAPSAAGSGRSISSTSAMVALSPRRKPAFRMRR